MNNTLKMEFDAYSSILNNLKNLAQELKARDPGQFQVTEAIRAHLLEMLDSMAGVQEDTQAGWA